MDTTPTEATIPGAQADEILDEDLEIVSMSGRILGGIQGRWEAATAAFNASFRNGLHDELRAAGLCPEPDAETPLADWERDLLNAEAKAAERPLVACKAPDPNTPGWFCGLRLGHDPDLGCSYRPVDQLPASADDEGDEPPLTDEEIGNNALLNAGADAREAAEALADADALAARRAQGGILPSGVVYSTGGDGVEATR